WHLGHPPLCRKRRLGHSWVHASVRACRGAGALRLLVDGGIARVVSHVVCFVLLGHRANQTRGHWALFHWGWIGCGNVAYDGLDHCNLRDVSASLHCTQGEGMVPNYPFERTVNHLAIGCGERRSLTWRSAWSAAQLGR